MSINKVIITGNLTRDPELRSTPAGTSVLDFGVAVNDRRRNSSTGEWEDYANFVDCSVFGARADALARILHKGMKVAIEGKLRYSSWEKDGQRRSKLDVTVDEIEFMTTRNNSEGYASQQAAPSPESYASPQPAPSVAEAPAAPAPIPPAPDITIYDEDIPF